MFENRISILITWCIFEFSFETILKYFNINNDLNVNIDLHSYVLNLLFIIITYEYDKYIFNQRLKELENEIKNVKLDVLDLQINGF